MLAWRSAESGLPWCSGGLLLLGLLISMSGVASETFNVRTASTQLVGGIYRLHAQIDYPLNEEVRKAVKSGIPLIVNQEIEILRLRRWLWPKTIKEITLRYQLRYHALSEQFVLLYLSQDRQRAYPNLSAAIKSLSTIKDYPLITQEELEPHQRYRVRLRTRLNIEDLPAPMRPIAYLSPQWHLDSPWFSWLLGSPGL
ncbi:conserved hypothetical protein [Nitrosococcus halophilus Nc 4]|uniref:Proline rich signal peptide protein n=1 Tax=Nitrosococcus halophilus (strain Nc4) TaxID=472759 RepID=D5C3C7_NITHN|nr:DUF4390 domain-containing protein [Nitrosococcus halophilus]ADE16834.1 conserved hypothetical protein [Nitrosococcus halophilus Nc 4]